VFVFFTCSCDVIVAPRFARQAKEILVTNQLQLESVCLNRLSDIWRLQQLAKENPENVEYKVVGEGFSWNQLSVKQVSESNFALRF
tara:strand:- start:369 stop:626 length:258 start_codon:yes stop_codon:yes gene_type:complete